MEIRRQRINYIGYIITLCVYYSIIQTWAERNQLLDLFLFQNNTTVSLTVEPQSTFYSKVQLPSNGSVTLRYEVSGITAVAVVYLSESVANPNSAYFDASFRVQVVRNESIFITYKNITISKILINYKITSFKKCIFQFGQIQK